MIFTAIALIVLCFSLVILFGAPYLPTLRRQKTVALDLLSLKPGQTLLELGSGDGRVLKAAAERGIYAVGYELNPILVVISWIVTIRYRKKVKIVWGNYWSKDLRQADGVYVFLHTGYMKKLDQKMSNTKKTMKLTSITYKIPDKNVLKEKEGVFLYQY